nr:hypothetical protein [Tanacetum cinerariifolium]
MYFGTRTVCSDIPKTTTVFHEDSCILVPELFVRIFLKQLLTLVGFTPMNTSEVLFVQRQRLGSDRKMRTIDEVLHDRLIRQPFEDHTFPELILYFVGLASSWSMLRASPRYFLVLRAVDDNDQGESSFVSKNEGIAGSELMIIENDLFDQGVNVAEELGRKRSINVALVENASKLKDDVVGSSLRCEVKNRRHEIQGGRVRERNKIILKLEEIPGHNLRLIEGEKEALSSVKASLRGEIKALTDRLKVVDLERIELVKDFLPLAVRKLMASDQFNWEMGRLQQKAMIFGKVKKIFGEAVEAFDKLEFPYIIPFEECGKKSQRSCHY